MKAKYLAHMGSDLAVVNSARVSFGKASTWAENPVWGINEGTGEPYWISAGKVSDQDAGLIRFLARGCTSGDWEATLRDVEYCHNVYDYGLAIKQDRYDIEEILNHVRKMPRHWTPFANGGTIQLHMVTPIFVARQLFKHQAGFEPPNEVSRRYVKDEPEFYVPEEWRKAAENVKQGSSSEAITTSCVRDKHDELVHPRHAAEDVNNLALQTYRDMLRAGVCPEQARMVLPQSMLTQWVWKGNLYAWATLYNTRTDSHTQAETRAVAKQIGKIIAPLFPVSWAALTGGQDR